ncbi:fumarylacetoacetate hydrolase family protein [Methylocystis sp. WRRC1]|uniref:fumarylacetoacetate hydrolase family protein n=1 Tax=Methylocystis sp. WRRC1 TaxID=1732014 RepID=UPI001D14B1C9|nr:fumarylacetoacetate hydrolase family protein [Methylocystis sp. WRRC1]MCC3244822.1 fumarylacetoacetate hydrolase family protein [Methylocystis sp. WRRC1]
MKLASLKDGRDGKLVVVTRDLSRATTAQAITPTMQAALDNWAAAAPKLAELAEQLESGTIAGFPFNESDCASPLPRAFQWADGSAYVNHVALVRKARGAEMPPSFWTEPLMYQGGSDAFLAPRDPIPLLDEKHGLDLEAEIAVVTDDVPMGVESAAARGHIKLVMLVNDVTLRGLVAEELAKGFGFFQSKPSSAFSPVAVTPDELGESWDGGKLALPLLSFVNRAPLGRPDAAVDMTFDFGQLIAHAARTRPLRAGAIIGSGTVSNRAADGGPGRPVALGGVGYSCLAEQRVVETLLEGTPSTPFLQAGDVVRIEMRDCDGHSIFGAIEQMVSLSTL